MNNLSLKQLERSELWPTLQAELEQDSVGVVARRHEIPAAALQAAIRRTRRRVRVVRPELLHPESAAPEERPAPEAPTPRPKRVSKATRDSRPKAPPVPRPKAKSRPQAKPVPRPKAKGRAHAKPASRPKAKPAPPPKARRVDQVPVEVKATKTVAGRPSLPAAAPWAFRVVLSDEPEPRWVVATGLEEAARRAEACAPGRVTAVTRVAPLLA